MARFLVAALAFSLLIFAGGASVADQADAAATPRNIPWDCSDWQTAAAVADAADERVSVILETLATNRGKTLYCGVDQSDTFTKSETWLAGKDRNERDDTVYYGANGRFRGFLAAQEGYLTDGESGVTGISRARIFEFPEEERTRRRTVVVKRENIPTQSLISPDGQEGIGASDPNGETTARAQAVNRWGSVNTRPVFSWDQMVRDAATAYCESRNQGYNRVVNIRLDDAITYEYSANQDTPPNYRYFARQVRTWTATCQKTKRVRR